MKTKKFKLAIVVPLLVLALSIVVIASSSAMSAILNLPPVSGAIERMEKVLGTISSDSDEVLHVIVKRTGDPEGQNFRIVEMWIDEASGDSRAIFRDETGDRVGEILIRGKERFNSSNLGPAPTTKFIAADTEDGILKGVEEQLWKYKWLLEKGEATVVWKGTIDERSVLKVEVYPSCCADEKLVAVVDDETKLPLIETNYRDGQEVGAIVSTYEVIETLKRSDLPKGTFESDIPQNVHRTIQELNLEQARNFAEFDLYYLGEEFDGLQIQHIQYYRSYRVFRTSAPPQNKVMIVYGAPGWISNAGDMPETYVTIEKATADEINEWQQHGREVQDGILRSTTREGYMKEFLRGGQSLVTLWGTTEKEIADMESALQRLK